ncbi:hypothetical protein BI308_19230 [Roseofilum reptotaenium AO1-A]|uniref:Uncharacterized protein n=1 Tax=Roseofilum reptotaenium AO1-A TaxID=1925591 RepID=A0A1L9QML9_9CYAN|nr:hypothetical protein BI308_19230 [Roseofilum reptotaenium AO1-A]
MRGRPDYLKMCRNVAKLQICARIILKVAVKGRGQLIEWIERHKSGAFPTGERQQQSIFGFTSLVSTEAIH